MSAAPEQNATPAAAPATAHRRPAPTGNLLVRHLPQPERRRLLQCCESVELSFGQILCEADKPYRHIYFPQGAFISLVAAAGAHGSLEMGLIGFEGMLGASLVLDIGHAQLRAVVRGPGSALRMTARDCSRYLRDSPPLRRLLERYLHVLMMQLSQNTACARFHELDARLARWLLMSHDRAQRDHFHLTHQSLADMLGVRRSGVTIAAGAMQKKKLIRYTRGEISIVDRRGLEAASCACYAEAVDDYRRLIG